MFHSEGPGAIPEFYEVLVELLKMPLQPRSENFARRALQEAHHQGVASSGEMLSVDTNGEFEFDLVQDDKRPSAPDDRGTREIKDQLDAGPKTEKSAGHHHDDEAVPTDGSHAVSLPTSKKMAHHDGFNLLQDRAAAESPPLKLCREACPHVHANRQPLVELQVNSNEKGVVQCDTM
jgi:hypothetical protein